MLRLPRFELFGGQCPLNQMVNIFWWNGYVINHSIATIQHRIATGTYLEIRDAIERMNHGRLPEVRVMAAWQLLMRS